MGTPLFRGHSASRGQRREGYASPMRNKCVTRGRGAEAAAGTNPVCSQLSVGWLS